MVYNPGIELSRVNDNRRNLMIHGFSPTGKRSVGKMGEVQI